MDQAAALTMPAPSEYGSHEAGKRARRWRWFQAIFACTFAGIVLDIITTAMGFQRAGAAYEQNPLGSLLINDVGWVGLFALVTAIAALCYFSVRVVCFRMATRWSLILNVLLALVAVVRWVAVAGAIAYLLDTPK
jgi:hypothetical protein